METRMPMPTSTLNYDTFPLWNKVFINKESIKKIVGAIIEVGNDKDCWRDSLYKYGANLNHYISNILTYSSYQFDDKINMKRCIDTICNDIRKRPELKEQVAHALSHLS